MQTVVETPSYLSDAERLLSQVERKAIVDRLSADPSCGVLIPGATASGRSDSLSEGAAKAVERALSICLPDKTCRVFILAIFAKNERANLSAAERNALGRMVAGMIENYRKQP